MKPYTGLSVVPVLILDLHESQQYLRPILEKLMNADNISQILVGLFLVFGRRFIVERMKDPKRKDKINSILKITGPIVLGCAIFVAVAGFAKKDDQVEQLAQAVNAAGPKIIDGFTRLDRATAGPGRRLTYHMTVSVSKSEFDRTEWKQKTLPTIRTNTLEQEATRSLLKAGITVVLSYGSKDGSHLDETVFTSNDLVKN